MLDRYSFGSALTSEPNFWLGFLLCKYWVVQPVIASNMTTAATEREKKEEKKLVFHKQYFYVHYFHQERSLRVPIDCPNWLIVRHYEAINSSLI